MPALFRPSANLALQLGVCAALVIGGGLLVAPMILIRTDYGTHEAHPVEQPVEFDHRHHVRDDGIPCGYCHRGASTSARAQIPSTEVCMGCHAQVWPESPLLAPVRESYFEDRPIAWRAVYVLPDFVYFHHGVHVRAGVPCARCHGDVASMPRVSRASSLTMGFCLDCHRRPPGSRATDRSITPITTCTACHR